MRDPVSAYSESLRDRRPPGPFAPEAFPSEKRSERVSSVLGVSLGVTFTICFVTGMISHFVQQPATWLPWFPYPAGLYRVTQGAHLITGFATIPLLLAKLWAVFPRLFQWPPFTSLAHLVERASTVVLVAGGIFMLVSGVINVQYWYPWEFFFPAAHFWVAIITVGALIVHIASQLPTVRTALARGRGPEEEHENMATAGDVHASAERRRFLRGVAYSSALFALLVAGGTVGPLRRLSVLAPRDPAVGPQGFPVNKSAASARVDRVGDDWRLEVTGNVTQPLSLSRDDLLALPQTEVTLPIACVEGWSATKRWSGVQIARLLELAGAADDIDEVVFESLQQSGLYRQAVHLPRFAKADDALVALKVENEDRDLEDLHLDHGYPARAMLPAQPGVRQTKWLHRLEVR